MSTKVRIAFGFRRKAYSSAPGQPAQPSVRSAVRDGAYSPLILGGKVARRDWV